MQGEKRVWINPEMTLSNNSKTAPGRRVFNDPAKWAIDLVCNVEHCVDVKQYDSGKVELRHPRRDGLAFSNAPMFG